MLAKKETMAGGGGGSPPDHEKGRVQTYAPGPLPKPFWTFLYRVGAGTALCVTTTIITLSVGIGLLNLSFQFVVAVQGLLIATYVFINESLLDRIYSRYAAKKRERGRQRMVRQVVEKALTNIEVDGSIYVAAVRKNTSSVNYRYVKRFLDVVFASGVLLFQLPLFALCASLIKIDSEGPALHKEIRVGQNGNIISLTKFRTIFTDSDRSLQEILEADPVSRAEYEAFRELSYDPRLTRVGYILRHSGLDMMPRLIDVLRGDLSLVGHRPRLPASPFVHESPSISRAVLTAKPGMVQYSSVLPGSPPPIAARDKKDMECLAEWSLYLDLKTVTQATVVWIKGLF